MIDGNYTDETLVKSYVLQKASGNNEQTTKKYDEVDNPQHYTDTNIEVIDYIEDKNLGFCLGNVVKYVSRAGRKHSANKTDKEKELQDLEKAEWYLKRRIKEVREGICD